ncbi:[Pyruvate dehydrogenase (acetyl-transferring)] kinase isozyme 2 [Dispira parvispora]|uniref:Protein-serine/threonine kinase n=1 Tax=Dispira parvispora TaxID=1520584 RepID=A0A9W8AMN4_9FUNG|nr:[Pyruvate dehydrogenase (acetyl-transferring)] kinase isozyme 2 [Dispira parvispora]
MPSPSTFAQAMVPKGASLLRASQAKITRLSLDHIYSLGQCAQTANHRTATLKLSAQFLHRELPARLYQNVTLLQTNKWKSVVEQSPILQSLGERFADDIYLVTGLESPASGATLAKFLDTVRRLQHRHWDHMVLARRGVQQVVDQARKRRSYNSHSYLARQARKSETLVNQFFDTLYTISFGNQFLMSEYTFLAEHGRNLVQRTRPTQVVEQVITQVKRAGVQLLQTSLNRGKSKQSPVHQLAQLIPDIKVVGCNPNISILHIEPYVASILYTLLFNALHTTIRRHCSQFMNQTATESLDTTVRYPKPPAITVTVIGGSEDVCFKVSDEGGGISLSKMSRIWDHVKETPAVTTPANHSSSSTAESPYHSLSKLAQPPSLSSMPFWKNNSFDLPLARLVARYFGGDLSLVSMEGHGTDAYLHLLRRKSLTETLPELYPTAMASPHSAWPVADDILARQATKAKF